MTKLDDPSGGKLEDFISLKYTWYDPLTTYRLDLKMSKLTKMLLQVSRLRVIDDDEE